jgi:hypothetical protein
MNNKRSFVTNLLIGIGVASLIVAILLLSGWTINKAVINLGIFSLELQQPSMVPLETQMEIRTLPPPTQTFPPLIIDHTPVILRITERKENKNGELIIYKDIYFTDAAGDAVTVVYKLDSTTIDKVEITNDDILSSPDEQKSEALVTGKWECGTKYKNYLVVLEARILDKAGNLSEPVEITFVCQ